MIGEADRVVAEGDVDARQNLFDMEVLRQYARRSGDYEAGEDT
jgi:hypothetical protein